MKKKAISLLLAAAMLAGTMLSGCGSTEPAAEPAPAESAAEEEAEAPAEEEPAEEAEEASGERVAFTYSTEIWGNDTVEDESPIEQYIQDGMNVDITVVKANNETMNTMIATGQTADCFWWYGGGGITPEYLYQHGVVRTFPKSMVAEYAPSAMKYLEDNPAIMKVCEDPENPDELRFLQGMTYQFVNQFTYIPIFRLDWIENLGIDLGVEIEQLDDNYYVASEGITYSKWMEIIDGFVNGDPDGNGVDDTFGISSETPWHPALLSAYGLHDGINEQNGEPEQWYAMDAYKDMLKDYQRLYAEGLMDPDIISADRVLCWDKMNNETAGMMTGAPSYVQSWAADRPPITLVTNHPEAKILLVPGIRPDDGEVQVACTQPTPAYGWFYINNNVDDDLLVTLLKFVEWTVFQTEDYTRKLTLFNGFEGEHWQYTEDGGIEIIESVASGMLGTDTFVQHGQDSGIPYNKKPSVWNSGYKYWKRTATTDAEWIDNYFIFEYKKDLLNETNFAELNAEYNAELWAYVTSYMSKAILGEIDVDATWEEYMSELDRLGYNELMAELEGLPTLEEMMH